MIVVFGSLNVDLMLSVREHPQPGETVLCTDSALAAGGKGCNQAVAAARAGARVAMVGRVGADAFGELLLAALAAEGVDASHVQRTPGYLTGCASVAIDARGENVIYVASGANAAATAADVPDALLAPGGVLLCQMETPAEATRKLLARAHSRGVRTVLNLAPARDVDAGLCDTIRAAVDVLVVNAYEARQVARGLARDAEDVRALAAELAASLHTACVVTSGAAGVDAASAEGRWSVPALSIEARDTTGAGDTFTGVLGAALAEGRPMKESLRFAAVAASLACRELGAQRAMPRRAEIEAHLPALVAERSAQ